VRVPVLDSVHNIIDFPKTGFEASVRCSAQAWTFAVSSIPSAFMTAIVVFNVGLPFSLTER
jgi:hypothetical protein